MNCMLLSSLKLKLVDKSLPNKKGNPCLKMLSFVTFETKPMVVPHEILTTNQSLTYNKSDHSVSFNEKEN